MEMTIMIGFLTFVDLATLCYVMGLREDIADLRKSKDDLRESMSKTNYYLHQQLERVMVENEALRKQNRQLRKGRNEQN